MGHHGDPAKLYLLAGSHQMKGETTRPVRKKKKKLHHTGCSARKKNGRRRFEGRGAVQRIALKESTVSIPEEKKVMEGETARQRPLLNSPTGRGCHIRENTGVTLATN